MNDNKKNILVLDIIEKVVEKAKVSTTGKTIHLVLRKNPLLLKRILYFLDTLLSILNKKGN